MDEYFGKINEHHLKNNELYIVFDDCIPNNINSKNEHFMGLLEYGHRHNIKIIMGIKSNVYLEPKIRNNFGYVFLFSNGSESVQNRLYNNYGDIFPSLALFQKYFTDNTKDFHSMVIDKISTINNINSKVFTYKSNVQYDN